MVKLLIIADDFTGALDTGVQFAQSGAETRVVTNRNVCFEEIDEKVSVLVLDAETRHLLPQEAYQAVFEIVQRARKSGIQYLYKKTDSALRGNIGSELRAVLDGFGQPTLHFLPAFPKMNRLTCQGIHYIDGLPVAESVFGRDPFEPVKTSSISELIKGVPVTVVTSLDKWKAEPGIMVYDAVTDEDLKREGTFLQGQDELLAMAGCAGFAGVLPELLGLGGDNKKNVSLKKGFFVACGSVNPITTKQLDFAEKAGFIRIRLLPEEKLESCFYRTPAGRRRLQEWKKKAQYGSCILDTNDPPGSTATYDYAKLKGITREELRFRISDTLGLIVKELVTDGLDGTILITGGDCLIGFMKHMGSDTIAPICELSPGIVLSQLELDGHSFEVVSKSGGFGSESLLTELEELVKGKEGEKICRLNMY
ncbi:MAG: four-carbon acid sugar kinase family protein [Clostridium sp.]|jgi:uncharacterized protein YgbK (DUF1537 family)